MKTSNIEVLMNCDPEDKDKMIVFRTSCACGATDCIIEFCVYDCTPHKQLDLEMSCNLYWCDNYGETYSAKDSFWDRVCKFFRRLKKRTFASLKMFFKGEILANEAFMFRDKEHALDFAEAIKEAVKTVENNELKN